MCRNQEPDSSEAAAPPWPQIQPVARLRMYFQWSHKYTQHIRDTYTHVHVPAPQSGTAETPSTHTSTESSNDLYQPTVPLSG